MKLKPEEMRDDVFLSKVSVGRTAWYNAAKRGHFELFKQLWKWVIELQLKPEELRDKMWLSKRQLRSNGLAYCST
jgi:hypothetical protein